MVETGQALWLSADLIEMLFTYYATRTADDGNRSDIGGLGFNQWSSFVADYGLVNKHSRFCKRADMDRLFLAIDGLSARREEETLRAKAQTHYFKGGDNASVSSSERRQAFNRTEFIAALCQLALHRYVLTKQMADVSDAVTRLLEVDLRARARNMHDYDEFRRFVCYRQDVTEVLATHHALLRQLYEHASQTADAERAKGGKSHLDIRSQNSLLNLPECVL